MLRVRLLGQLAVELDGAVVPPPSSRSAWRLIAWLALHPGPHERGGLAARFWPDVPDASARASLRSALWALRRALGPAGEAYLSGGRDLVALSPDAPVEVDARSFDRLEAAGRLEEAAALATGEFLTGLEDEWVLEARDAHRVRLAAMLGRLAFAAMENGDPAAALRWTQRQAAIDPLAEEPQRRLMELLAAAGEPGTALAGYERFRRRLERELGLAPSLPARRLADALREGAAGRRCRRPRPPTTGDRPSLDASASSGHCSRPGTQPKPGGAAW